MAASITIRTRYYSDDPEMLGDHAAVEVYGEHGAAIAKFGDAYHDKGRDKAEGIRIGVAWATGELPLVSYERVADVEP